MRTLLTTFSLAALFSLATACAVDPDSLDDEESESLDDVAIDIDDVNEATDFARSPGRNLSDIEKRLEQLGQRYCEQNYDCASTICDQSINRCRDYPF